MSVKEHYQQSFERDLCSDDGAERIKAQIERYWLERGENVEIKLTRQSFNPAVRESIMWLSSDMKNGWPRAIYEASGALASRNARQGKIG